MTYLLKIPGGWSFRPKGEILFAQEGRSLTFARDEIFTIVHIAFPRIIQKILDDYVKTGEKSSSILSFPDMSTFVISLFA